MDFSTIFKFCDHIGQVLQLTAVIWNVLLLVVLCRLKSPRRSYFSLVKSLTVADLLLPFLFFMFTMYYRTDQKIGIHVMQMINRYLTYVTLFHLISLSAEHFVAIMKPLHYEEWCHCRYIICRLVLCWSFPLLFIVLDETAIQDQPLIPGLIILCFLIMLVVYILIFCEVRKQQSFENSQNHHAQKNYRALMTTILNVVTFFLCWMPATVLEIWSAINMDTLENPYILVFLHIAANIICFNSICDALIYSIRLTEVQKMWRKTFCCIGSCSNIADDQ